MTPNASNVKSYSAPPRDEPVEVLLTDTPGITPPTRLPEVNVAPLRLAIVTRLSGPDVPAKLSPRMSRPLPAPLTTRLVRLTIVRPVPGTRVRMLVACPPDAVSVGRVMVVLALLPR